jgi:hypothetical protein
VIVATLRDDAQRARDALFNLLAETPGAAAYSALKILEQDHPKPSYRKWMAMRARSRAIADADEPLWTAAQLRDFTGRF